MENFTGLASSLLCQQKGGWRSPPQQGRKQSEAGLFRVRDRAWAVQKGSKKKETDGKNDGCEVGFFRFIDYGWIVETQNPLPTSVREVEGKTLRGAIMKKPRSRARGGGGGRRGGGGGGGGGVGGGEEGGEGGKKDGRIRGRKRCGGEGG